MSLLALFMRFAPLWATAALALIVAGVSFYLAYLLEILRWSKIRRWFFSGGQKAAPAAASAAAAAAPKGPLPGQRPESGEDWFSSGGERAGKPKGT
jgi:hypothetical protein